MGITGLEACPAITWRPPFPTQVQTRVSGEPGLLSSINKMENVKTENETELVL